MPNYNSAVIVDSVISSEGFQPNVINPTTKISEQSFLIVSDRQEVGLAGSQRLTKSKMEDLKKMNLELNAKILSFEEGRQALHAKISALQKDLKNPKIEGGDAKRMEELLAENEYLKREKEWEIKMLMQQSFLNNQKEAIGDDLKRTKQENSELAAKLKLSQWMVKLLSKDVHSVHGLMANLKLEKTQLTEGLAAQVIQLEDLQNKRNQISGLLHQKDTDFHLAQNLKVQELEHVKLDFEDAQEAIVRLEKDIIGLAMERNLVSQVGHQQEAEKILLLEKMQNETQETQILTKSQEDAYKIQISDITENLGTVLVEKFALSDEITRLKTTNAELLMSRNKWQVMYEEIEPEVMTLQCKVDDLEANGKYFFSIIIAMGQKGNEDDIALENAQLVEDKLALKTQISDLNERLYSERQISEAHQNEIVELKHFFSTQTDSKSDPTPES